MAKYDVVKDFDWCSAPRGSSIRKKAPRVWVKSYKLKSNQIQTMISGYMNIAKNAGGDAKSFYDKMYADSTIPEDDFNFPFFNDTVRSFSNTFGDTFQNGIGGVGIGNVAKDVTNILMGNAGSLVGVVGVDNFSNAVGQYASGDFGGALDSISNGIKNGGDPGSYIETPMFYQFEKNDGPLEVSFVLSNTLNDDYDKNHNLITRLTYINRPLRLNSIAVDPPRIFQVKVPGHRFMKWAYCSNFSISFLGSRRLIDGKIVPEGYIVNLAFQSLTLEHAGFLKETT